MNFVNVPWMLWLVSESRVLVAEFWPTGQLVADIELERFVFRAGKATLTLVYRLHHQIDVYGSGKFFPYLFDSLFKA
jgi:hypothetical protein